MLIIAPIGEELLVLTEENCFVHKFRDQPQVDHVYYQTKELTCYIFDCQDLMFALEDNGATVVIDDNPDPRDSRYFLDFQDQCLRRNQMTLGFN